MSSSLHACITDAFVYLSYSWLSGSTDDRAFCSSLLIIGQSGARCTGDNFETQRPQKHENVGFGGGGRLRSRRRRHQLSYFLIDHFDALRKVVLWRREHQEADSPEVELSSSICDIPGRRGANSEDYAGCRGGWYSAHDIHHHTIMVVVDEHFHDRHPTLLYAVLNGMVKKRLSFSASPTSFFHSFAACGTLVSCSNTARNRLSMLLGNAFARIVGPVTFAVMLLMAFWTRSLSTSISFN